MSVSDAYLFKVEVFKAFMVGTVEHYHYDDYLRVRHAVGTVIVTLSVRVHILQTSSAQHCIKNFAEFICHYENISNFVFGEHSDKSICL